MIPGKPLYLVIYSDRDVLGHHRFRALDRTFDEWPEADEAAKATAATVKKAAWVVGIERPSPYRIGEVVNSVLIFANFAVKLGELVFVPMGFGANGRPWGRWETPLYIGQGWGNRYWPHAANDNVSWIWF